MSIMKKTLITGINGSGATYLAEFLSFIPDVKIQGISRWHTDRKNKSGMVNIYFKNNYKLVNCLIDKNQLLNEKCTVYKLIN